MRKLAVKTCFAAFALLLALTMMLGPVVSHRAYAATTGDVYAIIQEAIDAGLVGNGVMKEAEDYFANNHLTSAQLDEVVGYLNSLKNQYLASSPSTSAKSGKKPSLDSLNAMAGDISSTGKALGAAMTVNGSGQVSVVDQGGHVYTPTSGNPFDTQTGLDLTVPTTVALGVMGLLALCALVSLKLGRAEASSYRKNKPSAHLREEKHGLLRATSGRKRGRAWHS
jgi:hypothetical protein